MQARLKIQIAAVLILCLLGVQGFSAAHGVGHLVTPDDVVCGLCLSQHNGKQALVSSHAKAAIPAPHLPRADAVRVAVRAVFRLSRLARAPPQ